MTQKVKVIGTITIENIENESISFPIGGDLSKIEKLMDELIDFSGTIKITLDYQTV